MILYLIHFLESHGVKVPAVFGYTSTRMILSAVTALLLSIFIGPYFIRKLRELKSLQTIRKEECPTLGKLHEKKEHTPTMGGILILFSMVISWILWIDLSSIFSWMLLFVTLTLGFLGGRDDYLKLKYKNTKGLTARKKMAFQAIVGGVIASYLLIPEVALFIQEVTGVEPPIVKMATQFKGESPIDLPSFYGMIFVPFFKDPVLVFKGLALIAIFFWILFVIVGASNSVNLTDGLDGLAAGCLIMVASGLSVVSFVSNNLDLAKFLNIPYIATSGEIAVYLSAFVGATLGFLWYNCHPAEVFMGDIGSLTLGGIIGLSAILLNKGILLGVMGGVFVAEALSVILQVLSFRYRNKKRIFLCAPLHHHFEYQGTPETKVVIRFWIISLLLAIIGIASLKFQ